jgi:tryptophan synthase alpha chain
MQGVCEKFAEDSASAGAEGVIVPDLPFDCDEGLYAVCRRRSMNAVPVAVPSMENQELKRLQRQIPPIFMLH